MKLEKITFCPDGEELKDIIFVADVGAMDFRLCNDMKRERILCFLGGLEK